MALQKRVCVLGAGIIGMTSAKLLKEKHPDWRVDLVADKFNSETLSDIAAGIFRPSTSFKGPTPEITKYTRFQIFKIQQFSKFIPLITFRQWLIDAYNHYKAIQISSEVKEAGVQEVSGYVLSSQFPEVTKVKLYLIQIKIKIDKQASKFYTESIFGRPLASLSSCNRR